NGSPNVLKFNGNDFVAPTSIQDVVNPGEGLVAFIFADDNFDGTSEGFPKSKSFSGTTLQDSVSATLNQDDFGWNLVGNPFLNTITWDSLDTQGLASSVYVYDSSIPGYRSWNG